MGENRNEFEGIFLDYKRYVYTICYQYSRSGEDAMDLTQEVFEKVYRNLGKIKKGKDLKPWIRRISVNTCINFKRDKKEVLSLEYEEEGKALKDTLRDSSNTENQVLAGLTEDIVKKHINGLRPQIRMAIILRHMKGLSYKEIADAMECPEGTIKTYIHKGRKILSARLFKEGILEAEK